MLKEFEEALDGKPATQGVCSACGTKMFRIGKG